MPRQPRKIPKKTKSEKLDWKYVVFADLHISAKTLTRAIRTLQHIRWVATNEKCPVICLGDFWDKRGILNVRQVHEVMNELDTWEKEGISMIMITGNHDQVNFEGDIHSLRIFDKYPNIKVIQDSYEDRDKQLWFIPWYEDPQIQTAEFKRVPAGYTVFGHGEAPGAVANNGHKMDGRFSMSKKPRVLYLGHFHKAQKLGNVIYIGSPFEQNFGEAEYEHGIAIVQSNKIEPTYMTIPKMPKHFQMIYTAESAEAMVLAVKLPEEQDIVQVRIDKSLWGDPEVIKTLEQLKATDVRFIPFGEDIQTEVPTFALTVEGAVEEYTKQYGGDLDKKHLIEIGKNILAQLPDTDRIVPLSENVRPLKAVIRGFCRIKDEVVIDLKERGNVLLQGRMRSGKTSLCDAITWCLFGTTTPRKAGSTTGSLRADDVIHDDVKECSVWVDVELGNGAIWGINRIRKRGKTSKVQLFLDEEPWKEQGVLDVQDQIHKILGMDYNLWRTCVYLGQGAVANFVTDADKARKDLLARAFGLSMCPDALKLVRKGSKESKEKEAEIEKGILIRQSQLDALKQRNYQVDIDRWERERSDRVASCRNRIEGHKTTLQGYQEHLEKKGPWEQEKQRLITLISGLTDQLTKSDISVRINQIHTSHGSLRTERDLLNRETVKLSEEYRRLQEGPGVCPTCGQMFPMENRETRLGELEESLQAKRAELQTFDVRLSNLQTELGQLKTEGSTESEGIRSQITEAQQDLEKANQALSAIQHIEGLYRSIESDIQKTEQDIASNIQAVNPFLERAEEQQREITNQEVVLSSLTQEWSTIHVEQQYFEFWEAGFSAKGLPVLVLRLALQELETHANVFLGQLLQGTLVVQLEMTGEDLIIKYLETKGLETKERMYPQLSGGQRRCVEMAFVPFALSEMIFNRIGVRIPFLAIDELTTHMDAETKPLVCNILQNLNRETILVIDHDQEVQGEFDSIMTMKEGMLC